MKMKRTLAAVLAAATVGTIGVGSAYAAQVDQQDTEVGIGFVDAHIPGQNDGDLQLRWVPKKLDFGKYNDVNGKYTEFEEVSDNSYYVVVSDTRHSDPTSTSNSNKWNVKAKLGEITNTKTPAKKLTKAQLYFNSEVKGYQGEDDPNTVPSTIITPAANTTKTGSNAPTVTAKSQKLEAGGAEITLMTQNDQKASADWAASLEDLKLGVGGKQGEKGLSYSGTLTWTLDDTL